jgi:hypothetical protein
MGRNGSRGDAEGWDTSLRDSSGTRTSSVFLRVTLSRRRSAVDFSRSFKVHYDGTGFIRKVWAPTFDVAES